MHIKIFKGAKFYPNFFFIYRFVYAYYKASKQLRNQNHTEDWALGCHPPDNGHVTH